MKIVSLSVKSFGKLSNVNLNFNDGINVITNVNGFGKTTMASFIRAMLYGFTYIRTKTGSDASRYAPWGSDGKFGGSMTVCHDGETYRIERFFGKTAKSEQLSVVNVRTNKPLNVTATLGEYFLGLTADSYDRSAYFPQEAVELSANDNFESRLANLIQNGEVDYDKVQNSLREYRKTLKLERGVGGKIHELSAELQQSERELYDVSAAVRRRAEIDSRLKEIAAERLRLTEEQTACKKRLESANVRLAEKSLTDLDRESLSKLNALQAKIARVPDEIEQDKQLLDELAKEISQVKGDVKPHVYPHLPTLILSIILTVAGAVLCFVVPKPWNYVAGFGLIGLGVVSVIIAFVFRAAVTLPAGERDALVSRYFAVAGKYVYVRDLDYKGAVKAFWKTYSDYVGDKRELEALKSALNMSDREDGETESERKKLELIQTDIAGRLTELAHEEGRLTQERQSLSLDAVSVQERIERLQTEIAEAEYKYRVAELASDLLAKSKDNLSSGYLPKLCLRCQSLLNEITNRNYEVVIDRTFNVQIRENGQTRPMSEFSRGIREITLLCFRVALSELLYDGAIPFVIVDDAFVNFDEDNFLRATSLLKRIARHGQVIYFTCHNRTGNLLK